MTILHLSDIHFGRNNELYNVEGTFSDKNRILDDLINCISSANKDIDHIIVTGDIAWFGKKEDFDEALLWFNKLLSTLSLDGSNITFCPGNHDVNRGYGYYKTDVDKNSSINELDVLYNYNEIYKMEEPFRNYTNFCSSIGMQPYHYPKNGKLESSFCVGYKDIHLYSQNSFRIVSFNTALLSSSPSYPDDLNLIGLSQVEDLIEYGLIRQSAIYTIAIFHHPERYLHKNEICEYDGRVATLPLLKENVNLILCGHTETGGKPILSQQKDGAYMLTAGAAYYDDNHQNSFSFIDIKDSQSAPQITQYMLKKGIWSLHIPTPSTNSVKKVQKKLPPIGTMKGNGHLRIWNSKTEKIIPITGIKVYPYSDEYYAIDNLDDPSRELNITSLAPKNKRGGSSFTYNSSDNRFGSVSSRLVYLELSEFLNHLCEANDSSHFAMIDGCGNTIYEGNNIIASNDYQKEWIPVLRAILKIENTYDIRFLCPDKIDSPDKKAIDQLISLNENSIVEMPFINISSISFSQKEELACFIKVVKNKAFWIKYSGIFNCILFKKDFSLGTLSLISGPYSINYLDAIGKLITFSPGDIRKIIFKEPSLNSKTFLYNPQNKNFNYGESRIPIIEIAHLNPIWNNIYSKN